MLKKAVKMRDTAKVGRCLSDEPTPNHTEFEYSPPSELLPELRLKQPKTNALAKAERARAGGGVGGETSNESEFNSESDTEGFSEAVQSAAADHLWAEAPPSTRNSMFIKESAQLVDYGDRSK